MMRLARIRRKGARVAARRAYHAPDRLRRHSVACKQKQNKKRDVRKDSEPGMEIMTYSHTIHTEYRLLKQKRLTGSPVNLK
jgi:hypothetical protein